MIYPGGLRYARLVYLAMGCKKVPTAVINRNIQRRDIVLCQFRRIQFNRKLDDIVKNLNTN